MKKNKFIKSIFFAGIVVFATSCTDLNEEIQDGYSYTATGGGSINPTATLSKAYEGLRDFQAQDMMFAMNEMSGDALVGPTRGGDWDDNAAWRQYHTHTWGSDHSQVLGAWNSLLSNIYNCNLVIDEASATASEKTQARFLRAFYYYNVVDLFGQAPYRPAGSQLSETAKVWTRSEGTAFCITELEAVLPSLPTRTIGDPSIANKDAAHFLLAKLYLNKAVFTGDAGSGSFSFAPADMTQVVQHVDAMTNTLNTTPGGAGYWANFSPNNNTSNELIFSSKNIQGGAGGNMQSRWRMSSHYNQTPGGWNGFATLSEFYNRYGATDKRANYTTPQIIADFGNRVGFQVGQQFAPGGTTALQDRNSNPLVFTTSVSMITGGATLETAGIRGQKYVPDNVNLNSPENDYILMRYADALLMKAEAIARGGSGSIGTIMNDIATRVGATAAPATLDGIYAERGRELWWEGYRRNDMIRFGKFLAPRELKPYTSASKYALYPIPADALLNPNIKQNPGY